MLRSTAFSSALVEIPASRMQSSAFWRYLSGRGTLDLGFVVTPLQCTRAAGCSPRLGVMINEESRQSGPEQPRRAPSRTRSLARAGLPAGQRREYLPTVQWHLFHSLRGSLNSGLSPSGGFHWRTSQASTVAFSSRLTVARTSPSWRSA